MNQPDLQQIGAQLSEWLKDKGVTLQVVAIGKRTGQACAIDDFLPDSHVASITLQVTQNEQNNRVDT